MPLDDRRLLLNGLQPARLSSSGSAYSSVRPSKRQKTEGMNSRFDRMIQTVNIMHGSPHRHNVPRRSNHQRAISSSSAPSHDVPRTPVDIHHEDHKFGRDFSVMKMRTSAPSVAGTDMFAADAFREPGSHLASSKEGLPSWLQGTISSLAPKHPLRLLAPGERTTHRDSSPSALDFSSDPLLTPADDESPFAFTAPVRPAPATPALGVEPTHSEPEPSDYLQCSFEDQHTVSRHAQISRGSTRQRDISSTTVRPPTSLRPFSTPGPASTLTLEQNNAPPLLSLGQKRRSLLSMSDPAFIYHPDADDPRLYHAPFSIPGPLHSPALPAAAMHSLHRNDHSQNCSPSTSVRLPALRSPLEPVLGSRGIDGANLSYSPVSATSLTMSPAISQPLSGVLRPSAPGFKPYSTPGPKHPLAVPVRVGELTTSPRPSPILSPANLPYSNAYKHALRHSYSPIPPRQVGSPPREVQLAEHALDFKWERFDRSNAHIGSSSSPIRVTAESEETFWSQPVQPILDCSSPGVGRDMPSASSPHPITRAMLPTHSMDQRSGLVSDLRRSGQLPASISHASAIDLPKTPVSQEHGLDQQSVNGSQEDGSGPFAWIVPPRDQPAPSTPRRRTAGLTTESGPRTPYSGPAQDAVRSSSGLRHALPSPEGPQANCPPTPQCGPSFAPAPGIYISPLRGEEEPPATGISPQARIVKASPAGVVSETILSPKRSTPDASQSLPRTPQHAASGAPQAREDEAQACEGAGASAIYLGVEDPGAHDPPQGLSSDIEEVDGVEGGSPASRDSIESWSD